MSTLGSELEYSNMKIFELTIKFYQVPVYNAHQ